MRSRLNNTVGWNKMKLNVLRLTPRGKIAVLHMLALATLLALELAFRLAETAAPAVLEAACAVLQAVLLFPIGWIGFSFIPGPRVGPESTLWVPFALGALLVILNSYLWAQVIIFIRSKWAANKASEATSEPAPGAGSSSPQG